METVVIIPNLGSDSTVEYEHQRIRVIKYAENSLEDRNMIMGKTKPDGLIEFVHILNIEKPDIVHFHELAPGRGINIFHVTAAHDLSIPIVLTFHLAGYSCFRGSLFYKDEKKCDGIIQIKRCTECAYQSKNITGIKAQLLGKSALALFKLNIDTTKLNSTIGTALGFPFVINKIKKDLLKLSSLAEKIVVLTEWYKIILEKNAVPSEKLIYIKQGLTSEPPLHLYNTIVNLPLKIVFIGRISSLKGLHLLIDAVCKLPEEKIALYIYGQEGEDGYAMECKLKSISKNNIHWMGTIPSEEVIPTLSRYHLLCLPSTFSEMSPLVIQEAFAAGLPVLASDVYGNAEQISDGVYGWLFRFKDSGHLLDRLKLLINDLDTLKAARLHLPVPKMFKEIALEHFALYAEIIRERKKSGC